MPRIREEIIIARPKDEVFMRLSRIDFMKALDPNFGASTEILFRNERLLRSASMVDGVGRVEIERIFLPEAFAIVTQRRPPLGPLSFQLSVQALSDSGDATLLDFTNEFETCVEFKEREAAIEATIRSNDRANLRRTKEILESDA